MSKTLDYYNKNADSFVNGTINVNMEHLYEGFLSKLKSSGKILDLGCGSGRDSKHFISKGFDVVAVDGSEELCKMASEFIGRDVLHMLFNNLNFENEFDGIWACSSLLHVPADELPDVFSKIERALKPGGIFYASFKYGAFSGERNGRFFTDLTEKSFEELALRNKKWEVTSMHITSDARPGRDDEKWLNVYLVK